MVSLGSLIREVERDVKSILTNEKDSSIEVNNVEASMAENSMVLELEGDIDDILPNINEVEIVESSSLERCKVKVYLDSSLIELKESEHKTP